MKKQLNILIPMAGAGSRFQEQGYNLPKPLIDVKGKPMIQHVVENIGLDGKYIFIVQKEHYEKYSLKYILKLIKPDCEIIITDGLTEGAACTTLLAKDLINNDNLIIKQEAKNFGLIDNIIKNQSDLDTNVLIGSLSRPEKTLAFLLDCEKTIFYYLIAFHKKILFYQ